MTDLLRVAELIASMDDTELDGFLSVTVDAIKGGPGSGNWAHLGRPGEVGGSTALSGGLSRIGGNPGHSHFDRMALSTLYRAQRDGKLPEEKKFSSQYRKWLTRITDPEQRALRLWGESGYGIRKIQSGEADKLPERERRRAEAVMDDYNKVMDRAPKFKGTVYRGLTEIPNDLISEWLGGGTIELRNDQSSSLDEAKATEFARAARGAHVLWRVNQRSGAGILSASRVTEGEQSVEEREVVMRNGTRYRIAGMRFVDRNGDDFPTAEFFEGTEYSATNLPEGFLPHEYDRRGMYIMDLVEE